MMKSELVELECLVFNPPPSEKDFQFEVTRYLNKNLEDIQIPELVRNSISPCMSQIRTPKLLTAAQIQMQLVVVF